MSETKTCGDPTCFACHFSNALAAFAPGDSDDFTVEQAEEIMRVIAQTAAVILSGEPDEKTMAFFRAVYDLKRREEREIQADSITLFKAIFGFDPTAGKRT